MSDILKRYNNSTAPQVVDAHKQSAGDQTTAVNYFDMKSVYQDNFTVREKGNTTVPLSNADDDTAGNFTKDALSHYNQEVTDSAAGPGRQHTHKNDDYMSKEGISNAPGIIYQSTTEK